MPFDKHLAYKCQYIHVHGACGHVVKSASEFTSYLTPVYWYSK